MKRVLTLLLLLCCFGWLSAQTYKIGDVYIAPDGSLGIVYYIHPDGSGGWVVALDDASTGCAWGAATDVPGLANQNPAPDHQLLYQQLLNDTAGYANTQTLRNYQNNSTTYAAGKVDFAHGWVLPSPAQLSMLYGQLPFIASAITGAGGTDLARDWYWCSGEQSASKSWRVNFGGANEFGNVSFSGHFNGRSKTTSCRVRAVRSFSNTAVVYDTALTYQWSTGSTQPYINVSPSQTTAYTVTATTGFGCSNTAEQTIIVSDGSPQTIYDTVCQGAGYEANGFTLTAAETATPGILSLTRTLTTAGCSSTLTLQLTVTPTVASTCSATACDSYIWNGVTYYESGDFPQTFTAANGCDSVVTLHLTINSKTYGDTTVVACEHFTWHGAGYTTTPAVAPTYTIPGGNHNGCDSIVTLHLTINHKTYGDIFVSACEHYTWHGVEFTTTPAAAPTYTISGGNHNGCDSTVTLHLTIHNAVAHQFSETACDSYTWNGQTFTQSGDYVQHFQTIHGCDSIVTLHLTVVPAPTLSHTPDTVIINGTSATLWSSGADILYWTDANDSILSSGNVLTVNPASSTTYYLTGQNQGSCSATDSILVQVMGYPDNVDSADCVFFPEETEWEIAVGWSSDNIVSNLIVPLVGDLDNDGHPEVACFALQGEFDNANRRNNTILVFDGVTHELKKTITMDAYVNANDAGSYGLVKLPNQKGLIVIAGYDYTLRAYDITSPTPNTPYWVSDVNYGNQFGDWGVNVGFADFNADGHPEVYIRDKIYNAETGVLLASANSQNTGSSYAHWSHGFHHKLSSPNAADVLGDNRLELILGNEIYSVDITNVNGQTGNSITLAKQIVPPAGVASDGHAQVADFNADGNLDIFVCIRPDEGTYGTVYGYVWDSHLDSVSAPLIIQTTWSGKSFATISDIDNDGQMEVLIQSGVQGTNERFQAYKYHSDTMTFSLMWGFAPDEDSYSNAITTFDFNQDGVLELLICDQSLVRVVNGSGISHLTHHDTIPVYVMSSFPFSEMTIMQYPVIVDVDADGHAEFLSIGSNRLNIFKSAGVPWAPARKVWNQYMYNVTNVNEDLTIPQYLFNNATAFTDPQGVVRRPFNNFLQQATTIDRYGRPFYAVPDVAVGPSASLQVSDDSVVVSFSYCNNGDNTLNAPYPVTVFANAYGGVLCTLTVGENLSVDSCVQGEIRLPLRAVCGFPNLDSLVIVVNGNIGGIAQNGGLQPECDTTNNAATVTIAMHSDTTRLTATACDSYLWHGDTLTQSGEYVRVLANATGCDSVEVLQLSVTSTPTLTTFAQPDEICTGQSATIHAMGENAGFIQGGQPPAVAVGDILCADNSIVKLSAWPAPGKVARGVVFYVDSTGEHGWAVHLQDQSTYIRWGGGGTDIPALTNYSSGRDAILDMNGYSNTQKIRDAGNSSTYPAAWAVDFGNGWYIPAIGQLNLIFAELTTLNASLQTVGGTQFPMNYYYWYWSSTEYDQTYAWKVSLNGNTHFDYKSGYNAGNYLRSIRNF